MDDPDRDLTHAQFVAFHKGVPEGPRVPAPLADLLPVDEGPFAAVKITYLDAQWAELKDAVVP
jgi:hypothetical protein